MIIDSHQHVFWHGRDDAGLIADMDEQGIDLAWLLSWEIAPFEDHAAYHRVLNPLNFRPDGTHAGIPLRDLLVARDRYPDRFILGFCPHPALGNAADLLYSATKMYGVQVCGEWKFRIPFDDLRSLELFYAAGELKLPIVLHLDVPYLQVNGKRTYQPLWYGGTVENLERALQACPETTFIGHAPGFWREISGDAQNDSDLYPSGNIVPGGRLSRLFDQYENLYADLSAGSALRALQRDAEYATEFLTRYSDRLLFARDFYGGDLHEFLQTLELSSQSREKIYAANAQKLLS
jgi:predicted TIM-barrel fold metal-dependent hydrolase